MTQDEILKIARETTEGDEFDPWLFRFAAQIERRAKRECLCICKEIAKAWIDAGHGTNAAIVNSVIAAIMQGKEP